MVRAAKRVLRYLMQNSGLLPASWRRAEGCCRLRGGAQTRRGHKGRGEEEEWTMHGVRSAAQDWRQCFRMHRRAFRLI